MNSGHNVYFSNSQPNRDGWQPIATAPHDGTVVEVRCTYGVAPWYGIFRWTKREWGDEGWVRVGDERSGFSEDPSFSWRPYAGATSSYVDPTGGAQDRPEYWRRAAAVRSGLPPDYFEKRAAQAPPLPPSETKEPAPVGGEVGHTEQGPPMGWGPKLLLVGTALAALVALLLSSLGVI